MEIYRGGTLVSADALLKHGNRTLAGAFPEELWPGAATARPTPAGIQLRVVSSSANDAAGGTGVREVRIDYLDASGAKQVELVSTNGVVAVLTVATDVSAILHVSATEVGSGGAADGEVSFTNGAATETYEQIVTAWNQSQSAVWVVPARKRFWLREVSGNATATATLWLMSDFNPATGQVVTGARFELAEFRVSAWQVSFYTPAAEIGPIPAGARIWMVVQGAAAAVVSGNFAGYHAPAI